MSWLVRIERPLRPLIHQMHRLRRSLTLGVRGVVTDAEGRVLLIEHTYVEGWHLPGGGVERGETTLQALERELVEEAGVQMTGPARLMSVHSNEAHFPGDHVLLYRVGEWKPCKPTSRGEIRRVAWFAPADLPEGVTRGTAARLGEVFDGAASSPDW